MSKQKSLAFFGFKSVEHRGKLLSVAIPDDFDITGGLIACEHWSKKFKSNQEGLAIHQKSAHRNWVLFIFQREQFALLSK